VPLSAVDFVPLTGQIKAASHKQFFDLFTGVMTDQPVAFANTLMVGGSQGAGAAPVRINGVAAQTANMIEARALAADVQPLFSIGPTGTISWGPGGATGADVTLRRSAANQLTLTGLAGTPALVIPVGGVTVQAGGITATGTPDLTLGTAASRIVPGATSLSLRNTANNADNLLVTDAGAATIRAGLTLTAAPLIIGAATAAGGSVRLPNSVTVAWRNGAGSADDSLSFDGSDRLVIAGPVVASTATAGGVATTPANNAGYLPIVLNGTAYKVALFLV